MPAAFTAIEPEIVSRQARQKRFTNKHLAYEHEFCFNFRDFCVCRRIRLPLNWMRITGLDGLASHQNPDLPISGQDADGFAKARDSGS